MVYNALKLFMEINPTLFDEAMQHYKQQKLECVSPHFYFQFLSILSVPPSFNPRIIPTTLFPYLSYKPYKPY